MKWGRCRLFKVILKFILQVTGILDSEVLVEGETVQPTDPQFWAANNLTTLWV